ncbi:hypothetical protein [Halosimplex sp. TS25]|uniref:hypothetical protein n=1 Tax=Halosimplex rarum TaxID=3396619 RepID=UPI0039E9857E
MEYKEPLEDTQQTLTEHLDAALDSATDETAVFHLRQARQMAADLPTLVAEKSDEETD